MTTPQIKIEIGPEGQALLARLRIAPERIMPAIQRGMDYGAAIALGHITRERFFGKGPFPVIEGKLGVGHKRGGRLRQSLRWNSTGLPGKTTGGTPSIISGGTVTASMGSNVEYFGAHEFGFNGSVTVRAHTRRQKSRDVKFKVDRVSKKTGRAYKTNVLLRKGTAEVSAHFREMNIPARAPLGHGIADHAGEFTRAISESLKAALGGRNWP